MTISELAEQLRQRQRDRAATEGGIFIESAKMLDTLPDGNVVDSYITCSSCGRKEVNPVRLALLIRRAVNVENFFDLLDAEQKHSHDIEHERLQ